MGNPDSSSGFSNKQYGRHFPAGRTVFAPFGAISVVVRSLWLLVRLGCAVVDPNFVDGHVSTRNVCGLQLNVGKRRIEMKWAWGLWSTVNRRDTHRAHRFLGQVACEILRIRSVEMPTVPTLSCAFVIERLECAFIFHACTATCELVYHSFVIRSCQIFGCQTGWIFRLTLRKCWWLKFMGKGLHSQFVQSLGL